MASHSYARGRGTGAGRRDSEDAAVLAAAAHLTDRDRYLVRAVADHRVLTTDQLAALRFDNIITARHRLGILVRLGVLRRFRPRRESGSAPWHYLLGPVGAALLGAEDRDEKKWLPQVRADRQLALERSQRLGHMTGANWFFVSLAAHVRTGGGELRTWAAERPAAEYLYDHRSMSQAELDARPHPDGLGIWAEDGRDIVFLLEYDTGTEHLPQLVGKLHGYAEMARQPVHLAFRVPILFCFPGPRREQSARRALAASADSHELQIATTAIDPRVTCPAAPVWMPLRGGPGRPMRLIDLDAVLPDPWRLAREQDEQRRREQAERELAGQHAREPNPGSYGSDGARADGLGDPDDPYGR
jgi:hypothetical protein